MYNGNQRIMVQVRFSMLVNKQTKNVSFVCCARLLYKYDMLLLLLIKKSISNKLVVGNQAFLEKKEEKSYVLLNLF